MADMTAQPSNVPSSWRRADWRFLLPHPETGAYDHLVLLGGTPALAEAVQRLACAREVSVTMPGEGSVDALIVLRNARQPIDDVVRRLRPSGVLYWEIDRRAPGRFSITPSRLRRYLRRNGLASVTTYWIKPDFERCAMLLPLAGAGPLSWYFRTLFTAKTVKHRLLGTAALWAAEGPRRFEKLVPCFAVMALRGDQGAEPPSLVGHARLPPGPARGDVFPLVLTGGQGQWSRITVLPFGTDDSVPVQVIKAPRLPVFNGRTNHEQFVLTEIRRHMGGPLLATVPEPRGTFEWNGLVVGLESYMDGRSLAISSGGWPRSEQRAIEDLRLAAQWLAEFHSATRVTQVVWGSPDAAGSLSRIIGEYVDAFGEAGAEGQFFKRLLAQSSDLKGSLVPLVWHHGDFGPENVRRMGRRIAVVDWEVARVAPPLCDLIYFILHWDWLVNRARSETKRSARFRELFLVTTVRDRLVEAARHEITAYMRRLEVEPRLMPLLLAYTLLEQAVDRVDRLRQLGDPGAESREDNPYVNLVGTLAPEEGSFLERLGT